MRVLGIDPGSLNTGWGVVEKRGTRLVGIAAGTIVLNPKDAMEVRLREIFRGLNDVIAEHKPSSVGVEDIFQAKFAQSALKLGQARGVALLAAAEADLPVAAYPPSLVKRTVAGSGRAEKQQVARIVGAILGFKNAPTLDTTDALAIAITHAQAGGLPRKSTHKLPMGAPVRGLPPAARKKRPARKS